VNHFRLALATCGGLGLSPRAPGTVGTLGGVLLAWSLSGTEQYLLWSLLAAAILYCLGLALGEWAEKRAGARDPGWFVLDEVVGYLLTVAWMGGPSLLALLTAFWAFRFFDIVKPPPVKWFERFPGGKGMMLDDLMAAGWAFVVVMLPLRLWVDAPWTVELGL
jgi:phosphatidylglycerophosphatase A